MGQIFASSFLLNHLEVMVHVQRLSIKSTPEQHNITNFHQYFVAILSDNGDLDCIFFLKDPTSLYYIYTIYYIYSIYNK